MKRYILYNMQFNFLLYVTAAILLTTITACNDNREKHITKADTASTKQQQNTPLPDTTIENDYSNYFIVIADSGSKYNPLDKLMYSLSEFTKIKVDTMNRYYNLEKKHIVLPDNDEDEIYRGDYYPRRGGNDFLSIEYTALYDKKSTEHNMCVVAGLFETKKSADSLLQIIKPFAGKAFVVEAKIYEGCLH